MVNQSQQNSYLKWISLIVLLIQSTACVLIMRYSRIQKTVGPLYLSSTAIVCAEVIKFFTCIVMLLINNGFSFRNFCQEIKADIIKHPRETLKVGVPAFMYVVQNNLVFFALSKLDAATYQVTSQLKILTTAFFFVMMLNKKLHCLKWIALIMLTIGIALAQLPIGSSTQVKPHQAMHDRVIGLLAVLAACCSSGFAGVYFEKILKESHVSIWIRNFQLAGFSIFGGLFMVWLYDREAVAENGFFQGYNTLIWIVVLLQAYGGLIVAMVVKYADNILKGFAFSLSIVSSSFISWWFLQDFQPTLIFIISTAIVIFSTFLYSYETKPIGYEPKSTVATSKLAA